MHRFADRYGPWALVTGPTAGIGKAIATELARQGLNLVLVARRANLLADLSAELTAKYGVETRYLELDLAREDFLPGLLGFTEGLDIGLLVNNAGFGNTGKFLDNPLEKELQLLHVNCRAPMLLAHAYGQQLVARGRGGIIFLASTASFVPNPFWANYSASKAYNLFLGNALESELRTSGVDVLALCPGGTKTEFHIAANIDMNRVPRLSELVVMTAEQVATAAIRSLGRSPTELVGLRNKLLIGCSRLLPHRWKVGLAGKLVGSLMQNKGG